MGEGLREIAGEVLGRHIVFLRQQANVVRERNHTRELCLGLVVASLEREAIRHPE